MDYHQLADTELIELFLKAEAPSHPPHPSPLPNGERVGVRGAIRDELFGRYYEEFDERIRAVLYTCGLPYSPSEFYYNDIFIEIYQRVFDLPEIEEILGKYRPEKGNFANWFMNYVVVNRVKDWLKKVDKSSGLRNIERLKDKVGQENRHLLLHESVDQGGNGLTLAEMISAETGTQEEPYQPDMNLALQQLEPDHKVMLRLIFMAYQEMPAEEVAHLAGEIQRPVPGTTEMLERIRRGLTQSAEYEQAEQAELTLAYLTQQEDYWRRKFINIESELEALFPGKEAPPVDTEVLFKDITQTQQELERVYRQRQIDPKEYRWGLLLLQRQHIAKQLSKVTQKRTKLIREYNSGNLLVSPSYKQLARIFNTSESVVSDKITQAIGRLKELLQPEGDTQKIRIREVEGMYEGGENYAK